jgi:hypothetical protein
MDLHRELNALKKSQVPWMDSIERRMGDASMPT